MEKRTQRRALIAGLATMPIWVKPVVNSVVLPAHAATSQAEVVSSGIDKPVLRNDTFYFPPPFLEVDQRDDSLNRAASLMDVLIAPVHAGVDLPTPPSEVGVLIKLVMVAGKVVASSENLDWYGTDKFAASNISTDGSGPAPLSGVGSCAGSPGNSFTAIEITGYSFDDTSLNVTFTTQNGNFSQTVPSGNGSLDLAC